MCTLAAMDRSAPGSCGPTWPPPLRQAGAGERLVITVDGRPVAQLGPLEPTRRPHARRPGRRPASSSRRAAPTVRRRPTPSTPPVDVRLDRVLAEVRGGVTLYVDTSALVRRYLARPAPRRSCVDAMADDDAWCASALARTEAQLALHRASASARQQADAVARAARRVGRVLGGADGRPLHGPGRRDRRAPTACASSTPSTSPPPTGCPARSATSPSTASRSPPPTRSASRWSAPSPDRLTSGSAGAAPVASLRGGGRRCLPSAPSSRRRPRGRATAPYVTVAAPSPSSWTSSSSRS